MGLTGDWDSPKAVIPVFLPNLPQDKTIWDPSGWDPKVFMIESWYCPLGRVPKDGTCLRAGAPCRLLPARCLLPSPIIRPVMKGVSWAHTVPN